MALNKVVYTDDVTVIEAQNLNDIQDAIIDAESDISDIHDAIDTMDAELAVMNITEAQTYTATQKATARTNLGLANSSISGGTVQVNDTIAFGELRFKVTQIV